jgi:hypothetical protein
MPSILPVGYLAFDCQRKTSSNVDVVEMKDIRFGLSFKLDLGTLSTAIGASGDDDEPLPEGEHSHRY